MDNKENTPEIKKEKKISCFVEAAKMADGSIVAKCPHCGKLTSIHKFRREDVGKNTNFNCEHYFWYNQEIRRAVFLKQVFK